MSKDRVSDSPLITQAKKKASHLKSILTPRVPEIKHSECLDIISKLERERDWNSYLAKLKKLGSNPTHGGKIDGYIKKIALPLISSTAEKYAFKAVCDTSEIKNGETSPKNETSRRLAIRIESGDKLKEGITSCDAFLEVTTTSVRFSTKFLTSSIDFIFPHNAYSILTKLLVSNKICDDFEPQISRVEINQETYFIFTINVFRISDTVDHGMTVFSDKKLLSILTKEFDSFFSRYSRAAKSYFELWNRWENKKLLVNFENSLWKLNSNDPPYMADSSTFFSTTICGQQFHGVLGKSGPYISGQNDVASLGVCSIIFSNEQSPTGFYLAKYGDSWQTNIHLKGFTEKDVDIFSAEFGIPKGHIPEEHNFYRSPAFDALCDWVSNNPKFSKRIARQDAPYLPDWYQRAINKIFKNNIEPTRQDFLNALENEPLLIDNGIRCIQHIDRKKTAAENNEIFKNQRESFANSGYHEFTLCCEWLKNCRQRKTINTSISSYTLKDMVEAWAKESGRGNQYVSNGAFIAAAIHMGFDLKPDLDSPNARFNISGKSPAITSLKQALIV